MSGYTDRDIEINTPDGCGAIEGKYHAGSQRVDLETGEVVEYQPPQPDADHEWNNDARGWVLRPDVVAERARRAAVLAQIIALESKQARPLREFAVNPNNAHARELIAQIESQIAALRSTL